MIDWNPQDTKGLRENQVDELQHINEKLRQENQELRNELLNLYRRLEGQNQKDTSNY